MEIDRAIRLALAEEIGADRYDVWFGDRVRLRSEGRHLHVSAPHQFALDRLRKDFAAPLSSVARRMLGSAAAVQYHLQEATSDGPAAEGPTEGRRPPARRRREEAPARPPAADTNTLDNFVVSEGTRVAVTSARIVIDRPGQCSPLFVYGPNGCGKTHLLEGIRRAAAPRLRRIVMLSAEQFTSEFLDALRGSGLPSFRRRYREVELLLLDDVHFFAGKRATLVELHHTIDSLLRQGRQLVLSADRSPAELNGLGPELVTRMAGGLVSAMEYPDQAAREQILQRAFDRLGIRPEEEVVPRLASQLTGDARQLRGAAHRLLACSEATGRPVTIELAESALADVIRATCRSVRISDIETAVCEVFGLQPQDLHSGRRTRSVSQPRMLAMWLARKHTRAPYAEIGSYFGGRSHSTVISASRKVSGWVNDKTSVEVEHGQCPIDDAIRRIETKLRA